VTEPHGKVSEENKHKEAHLESDPKEDKAKKENKKADTDSKILEDIKNEVRTASPNETQKSKNEDEKKRIEVDLTYSYLVIAVIMTLVFTLKYKSDLYIQDKTNEIFLLYEFLLHPFLFCSHFPCG
jgi:hypothetical protein